MRHGSWAVGAAFALAGCAIPPPTGPQAIPLPHSPPPPAFADVRPVSHTELSRTVPDAQLHVDQPLGEPFLIRAVLQRNPTLEEMRAAVVAAEARIPQAAAIDDPMVGVWTAPG